jgi:hypothetical protein
MKLIQESLEQEGNRLPGAAYRMNGKARGIAGRASLSIEMVMNR